TFPLKTLSDHTPPRKTTDTRAPDRPEDSPASRQAPDRPEIDTPVPARKTSTSQSRQRFGHLVFLPHANRYLLIDRPPPPPRPPPLGPQSSPTEPTPPPYGVTKPARSPLPHDERLCAHLEPCGRSHPHPQTTRKAAANASFRRHALLAAPVADRANLSGAAPAGGASSVSGQQAGTRLSQG